MTPHIEAQKGEIAPTVIMPGDPLRAKYIAENYLENVKLVSKVRNIYAYTGVYKGHTITVMASGMGIPSIGIYSYELYHEYNVQNIIRVGSCGTYTKDLNLYDVVLVNSCYSESSYLKVQSNLDDNELKSSQDLNLYITQAADKNNIPLTITKAYCTDVFYKKEDNYEEIKDKYGCLVCEMESFGLFANAKLLNKRATCLLTVSDSLITKEETTSEEREKSFNNMIKLALETAILL